jgi:hypothetical protein
MDEWVAARRMSARDCRISLGEGRAPSPSYRTLSRKIPLSSLPRNIAIPALKNEPVVGKLLKRVLKVPTALVTHADGASLTETS